MRSSSTARPPGRSSSSQTLEADLRPTQTFNRRPTRTFNRRRARSWMLAGPLRSSSLSSAHSPRCRRTPLPERSRANQTFGWGMSGAGRADREVCIRGVSVDPGPTESSPGLSTWRATWRATSRSARSAWRSARGRASASSRAGARGRRPSASSACSPERGSPLP